MKSTVLLAALAAASAFGAATETETFSWKDCPDNVKGYAIQDFLELVEKNDFVAYSLQPGKFSGVCSRLDATAMERDLVLEEAERVDRENARRIAEAKRKAGGAGAPDPRVAASSRFSFSLERLLSPEREIWIVHRLEFIEGREDADELEEGAKAVVSFEGTDREGRLVDGQRLKGLLLPTGICTVTNVHWTAASGGDEEPVREIDRLRRFEWVGDGSAAIHVEAPKVELETPLPVYFRTYGIGYLNAPTILPLWIRAKGGRFEVTRNFRKTCERCGGKGKWIEWKKTVQSLVSCPACAGSGVVGVEKTYVILDGPPGAKRAAPVSFD